MRRHSFSQIWKNIALSAAVVAVLFLCTELVFRVFYHPENLGTVMRFDGNLGWSLKPGSYLWSVDYGRGLSYRIRVNSLGMREREISLRKAPGKKRILILGDSVAFGTGVEQTERFSDILGRDLGDHVEVMNGAVAGYACDQEVLYFESFGRHLRPDIVVLTMTLNNDILGDMLDHLYLQTAPKPRFVLKDDSLVLESGCVEPGKISFSTRIRRLLKNSRFFVFVRRRLAMREYAQLAREDSDRVGRGFGKRSLGEGYSYWSVYERDWDPKIEDGWRVTEKIIDRFLSLCREQGAEPIVVAFPLKVEVDDAWRRSLLKRTGIDSTRFDFRMPYERLAAFCTTRGVAFVYPIEPFREASKYQRLYFERDSHPNANGHALAARVLHEVLEPRLRSD